MMSEREIQGVSSEAEFTLIETADEFAANMGQSKHSYWGGLSVIEQCKRLRTSLAYDEDRKIEWMRRGRVKARAYKILSGNDTSERTELVTLCADIKTGKVQLADPLLSTWFHSFDVEKSLPIIDPRPAPVPLIGPSAFDELLESGNSRKEISKALKLSLGTVSTYWKNATLQQQKSSVESYTRGTSQKYASMVHRLLDTRRRNSEMSASRCDVQLAPEQSGGAGQAKPKMMSVAELERKNRNLTTRQQILDGWSLNDLCATGIGKRQVNEQWHMLTSRQKCERLHSYTVVAERFRLQGAPSHIAGTRSHLQKRVKNILLGDDCVDRDDLMRLCADLNTGHMTLGDPTLGAWLQDIDTATGGTICTSELFKSVPEEFGKLIMEGKSRTEIETAMGCAYRSRLSKWLELATAGQQAVYSKTMSRVGAGRSSRPRDPRSGRQNRASRVVEAVNNDEADQDAMETHSSHQSSVADYAINGGFQPAWIDESDQATQDDLFLRGFEGHFGEMLNDFLLQRDVEADAPDPTVDEAVGHSMDADWVMDLVPVSVDAPEQANLHDGILDTIFETFVDTAASTQ